MARPSKRKVIISWRHRLGPALSINEGRPGENMHHGGAALLRHGVSIAAQYINPARCEAIKRQPQQRRMRWRY